MRTKVIRVNRRDLEKHQDLPLDEYTGAPCYFWYDPATGMIELWPRDVNNEYEVSITIEEKH